MAAEDNDYDDNYGGGRKTLFLLSRLEISSSSGGVARSTRNILLRNG